MAAVKSVLATPKASYNDARCRSMLKAFDTETLKTAFNRLGDGQVGQIINRLPPSENARFGEANYDFSDYFWRLFDPDVIRGAIEADNNLDNEVELDWPIVIEDGAMLSLCRIVSEGVVDIDIDTSYSAGLLAGEYNSRKADDEAIEHPVTIRLLDPPSSGLQHALPVVRVARAHEGTKDGHGFNKNGHVALCAAGNEASSAWTDCSGCLDEVEKSTFHSLSESDRPTMSYIISLVQNTAHRGISPSALLAAFPSADSQVIVRITDALVSSQPPILFWAGIDSHRLVSSAFLANWTLSRELQPALDSKGKIRARPCLWVDIDSNLIPDMWNKAIRAAAYAISKNPNVDMGRLLKVMENMLDFYELSEILEHLHSKGIATWTPVDTLHHQGGFRWCKRVVWRIGPGRWY